MKRTKHLIFAILLFVGAGLFIPIGLTIVIGKSGIGSGIFSLVIGAVCLVFAIRQYRTYSQLEPEHEREVRLEREAETKEKNERASAKRDVMRTKERAMQKEERKQKRATHTFRGIRLVYGFEMPENTPCTPGINERDGQFEIQVTGNHYELPLGRIRAVEYQQNIETMLHSEGSLMGGVMGAAFFGVIGAVIGSRSKTKVMKWTTGGAVIAYENVDGEVEYIIFADETDGKKNCMNLVKRLNRQLEKGATDKKLKRKTTLKKVLLTVALSFVGIVILMALLVPKPEGGAPLPMGEEDKAERIMFDAIKHAGVSNEQLKEWYGEPDYEDSYTKEVGDESYDMMLLDYTLNNGLYCVFYQYEGKTVMVIVSDDDYQGKGKDEGLLQILSQYGMQLDEDKYCTVAKTPTALDVESVQEGIDACKVTITSLPKEGKPGSTSTNIYYDLTLFRGLPREKMRTVEESNVKYKCQEIVKEQLVAPSSAKFPNILDWYIAKDEEKIVVQSYVDAQNMMGAMLRSEFEFILTPDGESIESFIFDGEKLV